MNSSDGMLTLSEIYQAISAKHPYYRMEARNWQNSIRHNLTLNKSFNKVPRLANEGRGSYWKLEDGAEAVIFKRGSRQLQKVKQASVSYPTIISGSEGHVVQEGNMSTTTIVTGSNSQQVIYVTIPTNWNRVASPRVTERWTSTKKEVTFFSNGTKTFIDTHTNKCSRLCSVLSFSTCQDWNWT